MSSWDILPPEGAEDSAGAGSGAGAGSVGSAGSAGALAARSFSMSSWDILPPEGAEDSAGAGSGVGTGSADSVGSAGALAARSFSISSWDILPPEGAGDSAGAGSSFTGASGALFSTISGSSESESSLPPSAVASSFSMSSWDILPPEGSAGSMISSVGVSTGSAGSAGSAGSTGSTDSADSAGFSLPPDMFISSSILCTSSCDITPPEDSSWERVAGSTCMSETGSGAGESLMPAERSSASMSSCDILLFSTSGAGA